MADPILTKLHAATIVWLNQWVNSCKRFRVMSGSLPWFLFRKPQAIPQDFHSFYRQAQARRFPPVGRVIRILALKSKEKTRCKIGNAQFELNVRCVRDVLQLNRCGKALGIQSVFCRPQDLQDRYSNQRQIERRSGFSKATYPSWIPRPFILNWEHIELCPVFQAFLFPFTSWEQASFRVRSDLNRSKSSRNLLQREDVEGKTIRLNQWIILKRRHSVSWARSPKKFWNYSQGTYMLTSRRSFEIAFL